MRIEQAGNKDIPAIAAIFAEAFADSVLHYCGRFPKPQAMEDVFSLVAESEPEAVFIARNNEGLVSGYCLAPVNLHGMWRQAFTGGHVLRWAWRWSTGQYGFGLLPVCKLVLSKTAFLGSACTPGLTADGRILSIAVSKAWQGQGVASALLKSALQYLVSRQTNRIRLEVRPDNRPAIRVYEKYGFRYAGQTCDPQGPWLIMLKDLAEHHG